MDWEIRTHAPAAAKLVGGSLYEVDNNELLHPDSIEGVPDGIYYRQTIYVIDDSGKVVKVTTYRTTNPKGPFEPTKKYLGRVRCVFLNSLARTLEVFISSKT